MTHTGQCLCGQVRYTVDAEPIGARSCWCRDCQRIASGSCTVNLLFPEGSVRFEGKVATFERTADSGNTVTRGFCPECGAQLFSATPGGPIRIRAGTLDDPELMAPQETIWISSAPSWAPINPNLPQHLKGPPARPA
jgi:hypothetical protein